MKNFKSMDGNQAAAHVAYAFSEVVALYPITPSSPMGEWVDSWAAEGRKNLFDQVVSVTEMQSEAGAAGAVHGALSGGAFCSTFTASQGLLLMIPNMYKIAGELMPCVFHVSARAIAGQALSIFGDHQDVMATRPTGFCQLCSGSVQEVMDLGLVAHLSSLKSSLPFVHFFDGFRTSHEIQKIDVIPYDKMKAYLSKEAVQKHKDRALNPEHPYLKGSAQNPDIYFQITEASNKFYFALPEIVEKEMKNVYQLTGRKYRLFDYVGDPEAEKVIIMMGSGAETAEETVQYLTEEKNEKVGLIKVRLFRPFSQTHLLKALPKTVKKIAVLDRTKESGSFGEPLYLDVRAALMDRDLLIVGGRYGLGSKDFTPAMVKSVFDNLDLNESKDHFTVGINDDVTYSSLLGGEEVDTEPKDCVDCIFWGLGGDGTVGANKDAIKIIGDHTEKYVQGYFSYDSKKSGDVTVSQLRFCNEPIHSTYLIQLANYVACHHPSYVLKYDILEKVKEGGIFVLNCPWTDEEIEKHLPSKLKKEITEKNLRFYAVDAGKIAHEVGLSGRINMIMQTVFFKLTEILPLEKALSLLKEAIKKTYARKGEKVIEMNIAAVDKALEGLREIVVPSHWIKEKDKEKEDLSKPAFIREVAEKINEQKGDELPVSAFTPGGIFPTGTTRYEKRDIALELPKWISENCIQCNQCAFVCPHAAIRPFLLDENEKKQAPEGFSAIPAIGKNMKNLYYSLVVSPQDCTGCGNCFRVCPAPKGKALEMRKKQELVEKEKEKWEYALNLKEKTIEVDKFSVKGSQFKQPLLEFSGACAGCTETPYLKLLTQLYGERMIVANATGCSSIWGGSAPSIPWAVNKEGHGPAWANSLFEDNAEYGFGIFLGVTYQREELASYVETAINTSIPDSLKELLKEWLENKNDGEKTKILSKKIKEELSSVEKNDVLEKIWEKRDLLTKPSLWIVGGDGWAYDIGFGGLDHVIAMDKDVNILVLDTEVYSNTGGQASKATPLGAVAKFASSGKKTMKKELGLMMMTYQNAYIASVCMGADKQGVIRAFKEAENFPGPSLIIAYASCIAHGSKQGVSMSQDEAKKAVDVGYWFNYRYDPRKEKSFQLDSKKPSFEIEEFLKGETRFNYLMKTSPEFAKKMNERLKEYLQEKYQFYKKIQEEGLFS